jgi:hypothetical protein
MGGLSKLDSNSLSKVSLTMNSALQCNICVYKDIFLLTLICLCSYADPEVVIGCEDGRAVVYDMYSRSCSRIFR